MAGRLDAAKRQLHTAAGAVVVDEDLAAAQAARHAQLAAAVTRPDSGHQTKLRGIGQFDGMVLVAKRHRGQHRPEYFFLRDAVVHRHVAQQGGGLVITSLGRGIDDAALRHHGNARHLRIAQEIPHALLLGLADQRTQVQVHSCWSYTQGSEGISQALQQGFIYVFVHQQPRTGGAGLARVLHDGVEDGGHSRIQVSVGKNDLRALAAQLQRHWAVAHRRHLLYQRAHLRAAGKADVVDAWVACQRVAHFVAQAGDDVDGAGREAGVGGQLRHAQQREAGVFGWLHHTHVAGRQRSTHAAPKNLHRIVPGNYVAGNAVGLAPGQHAVTVQIRNGGTVQLVAGPGVELEIARQRNHVGAGLFGRFAAVALFQRCQLVGMFRHLGRQAHQQTSALHRAQAAPHGRPAFLRGAHSRVDIVCRATLQFVKHCAMRRIDHGDRAPGGGGNRGVGDEVVLHGSIFLQTALLMELQRKTMPCYPSSRDRQRSAPSQQGAKPRLCKPGKTLSAWRRHGAERRQRHFGRAARRGPVG